MRDGSSCWVHALIVRAVVRNGASDRAPTVRDRLEIVQGLNISDQLNSGMRFIDFRLAYTQSPNNSTYRLLCGCAVTSFGVVVWSW